MTVEELLKPRYKVIADYPGSYLTIGSVIGHDYGLYDYYFPNNFEKYPAVFKKLEWWEERKPEEMPEYARSKKDGKIIKVLTPTYLGEQEESIFHSEYLKGNTELHLGWDCGMKNGVLQIQTMAVYRFEPATEEEYLKQNSYE